MRERLTVRWESTTTTLRRWSADPRALLDVAFAVVIGVLAIVDVTSTSAEHVAGARSADGLAYALVAGGAAALVWRRRAPVAVLAVVTGLLVAFWLRDYGALLSVLGLPAFYAVAAHAHRRRLARWALVVSVLCVMAAAGLSSSVLDTPDGFAFLKGLSIIAFLIGSIVAGLVVRNREAIFVDTERRVAEAEADRLAEAERAVLRERNRIAREMHDVVAHGMSVIAVQAAAGREIVHTNPGKAEEVFASIETVGRESLAELRRMLGVLRGADDRQASLAPQPQITDIATAVELSSANGVATALVFEGEQRPLAAGIELAAFRIVQEALTNVRKHAGTSAAARVRIVYESHALCIEVVDDGRGAVTALSSSGTGHGVIGMRERVDVYEGEFESGPRHGGGYFVRATLPLTNRPERGVVGQ